MPDIDSVVELLWRPFLADIQDGQPVYFSFNKEFLTRMLANTQFEDAEPVSFINNKANDLLNVGYDEVWLKSSALTKTTCGFSPAIVLVCQQILAVEEMVRDPEGFSENAYFPRLRRIISPSLREQSLNPFSFQEFEKIWRTFSHEIRSIKGSTDASVTFRFGVEKGINKARSFPLSQALLNRNDLYLLVCRIGKEKLLKSNPEQIWSLIRKERVVLRRKAQQIIILPHLRDRIVEQVRSFAKKADIQKLSVSTSVLQEDKNLELRIFKESLDWLTEEFRLYFLRLNTGERIDDEKTAQELIRGILDQNGYQILSLGEFGDYWFRNNSQSEISPGSSFLIIGTSADILTAKKIVGAIANIDVDETKQIEIPGFKGANILEVLLPTNLAFPIVVRAGKFLSVDKNSKIPRYEWVGGVCVSQRSYKYLRKYLPNSIKFRDREFAIDSVERINGRYMPYSTFSQSLSALTADSQFEFIFPDGYTAKLSVGIRRSEIVERRGFPISELGKIGAIIQPFKTDDDVILGYTNDVKVVCLSPPECAMIYNELKQKRGDLLSDQDIRILRDRLNSSAIPNSVKQLIVRHLEDSPKLHAGVIQKIRA